MKRHRVLCVGESMAVFVPDPVVQDRWINGFGGAESNVAIGLAQLGADARWFSAVGDDDLGRRLLAELDTRGVDVTSVRIDPDRPTGVYVKQPGEHTTTVHYYRAGSAASGLDRTALSTVDTNVDHVHLSGITGALSPGCAELIDELLIGDRSYTVSFDVNYRAALRPPQDAQQVLSFARRADIVFVGVDEASALWGIEDAEALRRLVPESELVIKYGAVGAAVGQVFVPALSVEVVEAVGAGDAFAAGVLAARLDGAPWSSCLRSGHVSAASALRSITDVGTPLTEAQRERLMKADAVQWRDAHVGVDQVRPS